MEKTIKINIPEGYDDVVFNEETNSIEFVKKDKRPKSWEEYCKNNKAFGKYYFTNSCCIKQYIGDSVISPSLDRNLIHSGAEAEAFLAFMQLRQLWHVWVGDWEPDWNSTEFKFIIQREDANSFQVYPTCGDYSPFAFPKKEDAKEFLKCFKDLFEKAKMLLG